MDSYVVRHCFSNIALSQTLFVTYSLLLQCVEIVCSLFFSSQPHLLVGTYSWTQQALKIWQLLALSSGKSWLTSVNSLPFFYILVLTEILFLKLCPFWTCTFLSPWSLLFFVSSYIPTLLFVVHFYIIPSWFLCTSVLWSLSWILKDSSAPYLLARE